MLRQYSPLDQLLIGVHETVAALLPAQPASRQSPANQVLDDISLSESERVESIAQMRINHTGELCAQALYYGQSLLTQDRSLYYILVKAAHEERDHLSWCEARLKTLGGHPSYLNLFWSIGAFAIGVLASLFGKEYNLGFLAETEKQVSQHLENHLARLSPNDKPTRAILEAMHAEEQHHVETALRHGGKPLPEGIKKLMHLGSQCMVTFSLT